MQNPILKFRQSSIISEKAGYLLKNIIIFEKPVILSEKLKPLASSKYHMA